MDARELLAGRLVDGLTQALELFGVHLGVELGLYRALAELGAATEAELGRPRRRRPPLRPRVAGAAGGRRLPGLRRPGRAGGAAAVPAARRATPRCWPTRTALALALAGTAGVLARLPEADRGGGGVAYADYGRAIRDGIAAANRPMFLHELAAVWLPAAPGLDRRLRSAPAPRVLDLGCGLGASSLALARAYPRATVLRIDLDEASVAGARAAAAAAGLAERVSFAVGDAAHLSPEAPFDLVTVFEALHDMGDPVGALRAARELLADGGGVLVADERVADAFTAPGDATERLMYGWSSLHCLPATLAEDPVEANGTVLRAPTVACWAAAGFAEFEVLAVDNPFWRFYRLGG